MVTPGKNEPKLLRHLLPWSHGEDVWAGSLQARLCGLTYLTAERVGPRETYPLEDPRHAPVVGPRGRTRGQRPVLRRRHPCGRSTD